MKKSIRSRSTQLLASVAIGAAVFALAPIAGVWPQAEVQAQVAISAQFHTALSPYGRWHRHPRWGEVWIVNRMPADWRPYTRGQWIYTDDWGWYWDVGSEEADWGWVTYHYGRWVHDDGLGWIWLPGDEWGPAWVDWRYGDDYVGWAPLPPEELIEYRDDPIYWSFVQPRYLLAPRVFLVVVPARERIIVIRRTKIVNRTVIVDRGRDHRGRVAVNAGIDPGIIARATGKPIRAAKVEPAVLRGTKVEGAREVDPSEGRRTRASVKETDSVIKPAEKVIPPRELGANEKGRLGERPPKAAKMGDEFNTERRSGNQRSGDQERSPPTVNIIRGGSGNIGPAVTSPPPRERGSQQDTRFESPPTVRRPAPEVNIIRGGSNNNGSSVSSSPPGDVMRGRSSNFDPPGSPPPRERGHQQGPRFESPSAVNRSSPPAMMQAPSPPPAAHQRGQQEQRDNRQNKRQQDEKGR